MKKIFFICSVICSGFLYSQTWVEMEGSGYECEFTVISKEQQDRLLKQYEETYEYCDVRYIDALELGSGGRVISGTRPTFSSYYRILIKRKTIVGVYYVLVYGHPSTGRRELHFSWNPYSGDSVNSNEYVRKYNLYTGWVNGE